ncbi:MAG TPA: dephospho-CoA kinase [Rhodocyclaceae bacterium]|nr:dephospho-CoA kinase [Rhodocyclaceae bacterium]
MNELLRPQREKMRPFVVGLTGGIGSGKSSAAQRFNELGATVVDTDVIAHRLTEPCGVAMSAIRQVFGNEVVGRDRALDRAAMRRIVFADDGARAKLEAILHPMIRACSDEEVAAATGSYVVLVVPLLIESAHYRERCDRIAVVDCSEQAQIERAVKRGRLTERDVRAIIAAQAGRDVRRAAAHDIIDNGGSFDSLRHQVDALHALYLQMAEKRAGEVGDNRGGDHIDNRNE